MPSQKSASPEITPGSQPAPRSEALEAELAMLEAMLPPEAESSARPAPVDPPTDREGAP